MTSDPAAVPPSHPDPHFRLLVAVARRQNLTIPQTAYVLALALHESRMGQVLDRRTSGWNLEGNLVLGNTEPGDGPRFRGRGYVPITGRTAYDSWSHYLDLPLLTQPELVATPEVAADILVKGVTYGRFTGRTLSEFVNEVAVDYVAARRTVPDHSQAGTVAAHARRFEATLTNPRPQTASPTQVCRAQRALVNIGWRMVVDGLLTQTTRQAIEDFQRGYTFALLDPTGQLDEPTMDALMACEANSGRASPNFRFAEFASRTRSLPTIDNRVLRVDRRLVSALERYRSVVGGPVLIALGYQSSGELTRHGGPRPRFHGGHDQGLAVDLANPVLPGRAAAELGLFSAIGERHGLAVHLAVDDGPPRDAQLSPTRFDLA